MTDWNARQLATVRSGTNRERVLQSIPKRRHSSAWHFVQAHFRRTAPGLHELCLARLYCRSWGGLIYSIYSLFSAKKKSELISFCISKKNAAPSSSPTVLTRREAGPMSTVSTIGGSTVRGRRFRRRSTVWQAAIRILPFTRTNEFAAKRQWMKIWPILAELS